MPKYEVHPVTLTEAERNDRARTLAARTREMATMEEEAKEAARIAKEQIKEVAVECAKLAKAAHTGIEERTVMVDHRPNRDRYIIETFDVETGEVVAQRPMREDELRAAKQTLLPLRDAPPATVTPIREGTSGASAEGIRPTTGGVSPLRGTTRNGVTT